MVKILISQLPKNTNFLFKEPLNDYVFRHYEITALFSFTIINFPYKRGKKAITIVTTFCYIISTIFQMLNFFNQITYIFMFPKIIILCWVFKDEKQKKLLMLLISWKKRLIIVRHGVIIHVTKFSVKFCLHISMYLNEYHYDFVLEDISSGSNYKYYIYEKYY